MKYTILTKSYLKHHYTKLGETYAEIGKQVDLSAEMVRLFAIQHKIPARRSGRRSPDLAGKVFGNLTVVERTQGSDKRHPVWLCKCDCGSTSKVQASSLVKGRISNCASCGNKRKGDALWKGHGEISGHFWSNVRNGAKYRNLPLKISMQQAWELFLEQNRLMQ